MQKRDKNIENKKSDFLEKLRSITYSGNVTMVCQALGISRTQVYQWRSDNPQFAQEWDWAIRESVEPEVYGDKVELKGKVDSGPPLEQGFVDSLERLIKNIKLKEKAQENN